mgnify:CR=1 FL=1
MSTIRVDISAPNIVNVCVDNKTEAEKKGRMYCCYRKDAFYFENELHLIREMERFMDSLNYPQKAMDMRSYSRHNKVQPVDRSERVNEVEDIMKERGTLGTFIIQVQYRQNATGQGKVIHVESGDVIEFRSVLELLKIMDCEV